MKRERTAHILQPTELVHEAYLRLVGSSQIGWESRAHFFGTVARAMRQLLVERARRRLAAKRHGGWERVTLDRSLNLAADIELDILLLDDLLVRLAEMDSRKARVVELRVFTGMKVKEVAHVLDVSLRTVGNDWRVAKKWLTQELMEGSVR